MSDSGFPPSAGPKIGPQSFPPARSDGQAVRIEQATGELQVVTRPQRLEGEVVRHNRDGTIRIRTEKGEIDIRLRPNEPPPPEGQKVEIDIPPGKPPRQAVIRDVPPPADEAPRPQPQQPVATARRTAETKEPPPQRPQTRLAPDSFASGITPKSDAPPQIPLKPQDIVRLLPLPPDGSVPVIQTTGDIIEQTVQTIIARTQTIAALKTEAVQNEQLQTPVTAPQSATAQIPPEILPRIPVTVLSAPQIQITPEKTILPLLYPETAAAPSFLTVSRNPSVILREPTATEESLSFPETPGILPPASAGVQDDKGAFKNSPTLFVFLQDAIKILNDTPPLRFTPASPAAQAKTTPDFFTLPPSPSLHHFPLAVVAQTDDIAALLKPALFFKPATPAPITVDDVAPIATPAAQTGLATTAATAKPAKIDTRIAAILPPPVRLVAPGDIQTQNAPLVPGSVTSSFPAPAGDKAVSPQASLPKILQQLHAPHMPHIVMPDGLPPGRPENITAPVIGRTPDRLPIISLALPGRAHATLFALQVPAANLPDGALVTLTPVTGMQTLTHSAAASPNTMLPLAAPATAFELFGSFEWPALDELIQVLRQQGETQTIQSMARTIAANPSNPARLPAAALFFIAAVRSGDIASWLGDKTIDILRRAGRGDILGRLSRDAAGLQKSDSAPVSQDWRGMALPMYWDNELQKMMLWYREDRSQDEQDQEKKRGARFLFDLNLSRMGPVQLDGLFRPKKLDLIVRSQTPFSPAMQQTMRKTYVNALEQAGLSGELSFQGKKEQFVKIDVREGIVVSV